MPHRIFAACMFIIICMTSLAAQSETNTVPPPVPEEMSHEDVSFYAVIGGQQSGPYHWDDLMQLKRYGQFSGRTLVWKEGMSAWAWADQMPELSEMFPVKPPIIDDMSEVPDASNDEIRFYVKILNMTVGPLNLYTLQIMKDHLRFNKNMLVWREGMISWKAAKEVPELDPVFSRRSKKPFKERHKEYVTQDYNPDMIESDPSQEPLTENERFFLDTMMHDWWGLNPSDKDAVWSRLRKQLRIGKGLARSGPIIGLLGIPIAISSGVLAYRYNDNAQYRTASFAGVILGTVMAAAGMIMTPLCAIPFYNAGMISTIYHKVTGDKFMTFLRRTSIGGGYDWDKKEVTVAMAIRL